MKATEALWLLTVPVSALLVAAFARRVGLSAPLVLVIGGLVLSFLPGVPHVELDPHIVLFFFLPPLLFSAAWESSTINLRRNSSWIVLLSVGLVLFTTLVIGYAAHLMIPGLPLPAAFALGAIVAPPDAVAAVSVARRLGLPRRIVTILVGESLFNDATALTALRLAVAAAVGAGFTLLDGVREFLMAAVLGTVVGLALGPPLHWLRTRLRDPLVENAMVLAAPFAAYLIAEAAQSSGVIAVVVSGLYLGHRFPEAPAATRLIGHAFWKVLIFVLESVVFLLIGLQLPLVVQGLTPRYAWTSLAVWASAIFGLVVLARFVYVFAVTSLRLRVARLTGRGDPGPVPLGGRVVVGWAGMRGVVSLAAAFAIPFTDEAGRPFPARELILFLTFTTVLATLLVQGLTFPTLIRRLGVGSERERYSDTVSEAGAQHAAANAALRRLDELLAEEEEQPDEAVVQRLRQLAEHRQRSAWEQLGGGTAMGGMETPSSTYRRLRREMLAAERGVFIEMRNQRRIDDEVLNRVLHELDLEEAALNRP
ncbi:Na+/H+ antiporter [Actinomadura sp. SCN-SB]|uniref:Na+/H+ antiporter n=1 Tax=Actinomadura sp. SCN-SB TaxID=3373092 RepID=UPI0037530A39